jgi:hypothetical protein
MATLTVPPSERKHGGWSSRVPPSRKVGDAATMAATMNTPMAVEV